MTDRELVEVIENFEAALAKNKIPDFKNNPHRVEQVLRILKRELARWRTPATQMEDRG